jgi:hypothetical protein
MWEEKEQKKKKRKEAKNKSEGVRAIPTEHVHTQRRLIGQSYFGAGKPANT